MSKPKEEAQAAPAAGSEIKSQSEKGPDKPAQAKTLADYLVSAEMAERVKGGKVKLRPLGAALLAQSGLNLDDQVSPKQAAEAIQAITERKSGQRVRRALKGGN